VADLCIGQGMAIGKTIRGPCKGPGSQPISLDEAAKLVEEAVDKAQADASKKCAAGCECKGEAILGAPYCVDIKDEGGNAHYFIVRAAFYGECVCPQKGVKGGGAIKGRGYREFFRKVEKLPELPRRPTGKCRMYKRQIGHGFPIPVCAGDCPKGKKCKGADVTWKGEEFTIIPCDCR